MKTVMEYTSAQATEDGMLFDITTLNEKWKQGIFSHVTTNLLSKGHESNDEINIPNMLDLLNQANNIVRVASNGFKDFDVFFSGDIELPSGEQQKIFVVQNETEKFTIMLPEDY